MKTVVVLLVIVTGAVALAVDAAPVVLLAARDRLEVDAREDLAGNVNVADGKNNGDGDYNNGSGYVGGASVDDGNVRSCWVTTKRCCKVPEFQEGCNKVLKSREGACVKQQFRMEKFPCGKGGLGDENGNFKGDGAMGSPGMMDNQDGGKQDGQYDGNHNGGQMDDGKYGGGADVQYCVRKVPYMQPYKCQRQYNEEHCGNVLCVEMLPQAQQELDNNKQ